MSLDIFKSATFLSGYSFRQHVSGESGMRIRSLEWKFFKETLWIRNRVHAKSGYYFIRWISKIEPSSLPWMLYSRWQPRSQVLSRQSKMQISRALRRMLCCQYSQRSSGYESESGYVSDTCGRANSICTDWIRVLKSGKKKFWVQNYPQLSARFPWVYIFSFSDRRRLILTKRRFLTFIDF